MPDISLALVCDFFFPCFGGVEFHIKELAKYTKTKISKTIIITHQYEGYTGVREIQGIKVYYLVMPCIANTSAITFFFEFAEAKQILEDENINLIHCHQTTSTLALEYAFFAKVMGIKVILTEHSLFGFKKVFYIYLNWLLNAILPEYDRIICVSRSVRNNILLRSQCHPSKSIVVPNFVIIEIPKKQQTQEELHQQEEKNIIKIVVVGRLTYRRGIDLLIDVLPDLCRRNADVRIYVVGDGVKMSPLRKIIDIHQLKAKVFLLGAKPHKETLQIVQSCHIFLNTSLTQSFGIAIVEAACLGLYVVSTDVGGIHQTLPTEILHTAEPTKNALISKIEQIVKALKSNPDGIKRNKPFQSPYKYQDCCERVLEVYKEAIETKFLSKTQLLKNIFHRKVLKEKFQSAGIFIILVFLILMAMDFVLNFCKRKGQRHQRMN